MKIILASIMLLMLINNSLNSEYTNTHTNTTQNKPGSKRNPASTNAPCNNEMMLTYGLSGNKFSSNNPHKYCPAVNDNCCTVEDADLSMRYWLSDSSRKIEAYYERYLYALKYLMGFGHEVQKLADKFNSPEHPSQCREASKDYQNMNWNPQVIKEIYRTFVFALEAIGDVRKGFYCILCDVNTQQKLKDFWSITNVFYQDRIYLNQEFCDELVEYTIRASYYQYFFLRRYLKNAVTLMRCNGANSDVPEYDLPYWTGKQVELCYQYKNTNMFFFCENYCENFHLTKGNSVLDGNVDQLIKFVNYFRVNRNEGFFDSGNNFMLGSLGYVEELFDDTTEMPNDDLVFFPTTNTNVQLQDFTTDVLYDGGFNPFDSTEGSLYPLYLASNKILTACFGFLLFLLSA